MQEKLQNRTEDHKDHGHRDLWQQFPAKQDDQNSAQTERKGKRMDLWDLIQDVGEQRDHFTGTGGSAEEFRHLHQDDGETDPGDKTAHDRDGDIFDDPAGF